ncbi:MAG: maleylacetoacetate isomerase [Sandarakinorhabdus sp.]|nr:maleylacetoacetate isomerase [Sandarakinorhabdus sp.]
MALTLYNYWRSSAAYRVRLALAWKGLSAAAIPVDIRTGAQSGADYRALNPQGLVPVLIDGDAALTQSLAIIEYLEEVHPLPPLLPADAIGRARVRAAALLVAADIHPVNNLRVGNYLKAVLGHDQMAVDAWSRHWIAVGFDALEAFASAYGGRFLHGDALSVADLCVVPQLYNARRVSTELRAYPRLLAVEHAVLAMDFAAAAHPDIQPDASTA